MLRLQLHGTCYVYSHIVYGMSTVTWYLLQLLYTSRLAALFFPAFTASHHASHGSCATITHHTSHSHFSHVCSTNTTSGNKTMSALITAIPFHKSTARFYLRLHILKLPIYTLTAGSYGTGVSGFQTAYPTVTYSFDPAEHFTANSSTPYAGNVRDL